MEQQTIEIKHLDHSPLNARREAARGSLEELKASILAHGLMQNLVVTAGEAGSFRVIAGSRRLEAIRALQREGKLPEDYAAPCHVVPDGSAAEMSLAENVVRLAMHPADEFEAYARLVEDGESVETIAERFGVTARHVEQRLTLGKLDPELIEAYRAEALTLDALMAFTVTDDRAKQIEVYRSLQPWQVKNPRDIRSILAGEMAEATSKLARFVGLDAYHAAGGTSRPTCSATGSISKTPSCCTNSPPTSSTRPGRRWRPKAGAGSNAVPNAIGAWCTVIESIPNRWMRPPELLERQAAVEDELEEIAQALEDGESDALLDAQEKAEAQLAEIERQLEASVAYDPEQMRLAGCVVSIGHDGELEIDKGLVRRQDVKLLTADAGAGPRKPRGMPETLKRDLEAYRLQAAQVEIARHRLIALDLLSYKAARAVLARRPVQGGPDVQFQPHGVTPSVQKERTKAGDALAAIAETLPTSWLHQETEAEQFQAFLGLSDRDRLDFLAYGVALSLKPQLSTGCEASAYELALSLTDADLAFYWRPTRANYLGRITRDRLLALGGNCWATPGRRPAARTRRASWPTPWSGRSPTPTGTAAARSNARPCATGCPRAWPSPPSCPPQRTPTDKRRDVSTRAGITPAHHLKGACL